MSLWGEETWTTSELSEVLGISAQRIGHLVKEGTLARPTNGTHDAKQAVRAYIQLLKKRLETRSKDGEAVRKIELENEIRVIKLKRIAGELVPVERVKLDWFHATRRVRDALLNLPSRLSGVFAAESRQDKIFAAFTKEIHAVLLDLARGNHDQTKQPAGSLEPEPERGMAEYQAEGLLPGSAQSGALGFCDEDDTVGDREERDGDQEDFAEGDEARSSRSASARPAMGE